MLFHRVVDRRLHVFFKCRSRQIAGKAAIFSEMPRSRGSTAVFEVFLEVRKGRQRTIPIGRVVTLVRDADDDMTTVSAHPIEVLDRAEHVFNMLKKRECEHKIVRVVIDSFESFGVGLNVGLHRIVAGKIGVGLDVAFVEAVDVQNF